MIVSIITKESVRQLSSLWKYRNIWIIAALLISFLHVDSAQGQESPDTKLWLSQKVSLGRGRWTYIVEVKQRFYDDISRWEELFGNIGVAYRLSRTWSASAFFRLRADQFNSDEEQIERRPYFDLEYNSVLFNNIQLALRQRYEYRDFDEAVTKHRLRERIKLSCPIYPLTDSKYIKIYVSDEIFYPLDTHNVSLHEFQFGIEIPIKSRMLYQLFWGHEIRRRGDSLDYHTNIIGIELGWKF